MILNFVGKIKIKLLSLLHTAYNCTFSVARVCQIPRRAGLARTSRRLVHSEHNDNNNNNNTATATLHARVSAPQSVWTALKCCDGYHTAQPFCIIRRSGPDLRKWGAVMNLLWSPYVIGQTIIFLPRDFYLSSFFLLFPRLISAAIDWMSTILPHMVWP